MLEELTCLAVNYSYNYRVLHVSSEAVLMRWYPATSTQKGPACSWQSYIYSTVITVDLIKSPLQLHDHIKEDWMNVSR